MRRGATGQTSNLASPVPRLLPRTDKPPPKALFSAAVLHLAHSGDVVYARVSVASRDLDPEVVCVDSTCRAAGFGQLKGGLVSSCTTGLARRQAEGPADNQGAAHAACFECLSISAPCCRLLSRPPCAILSALGQQLQFEVAVGMNGRLWVNSPDATTTVLVTNALLNSELLTEGQSVAMAEKLLQRVKDM